MCLNQVSIAISLLWIYDQNSFFGNSLDKMNKNGGRNWDTFLVYFKNENFSRRR